MPQWSRLVPLALVLAIALLAPCDAPAQDLGGPAHLDEISIDLNRAPDSLGLAAGLNLGNVRAGGLYWYVGGRISWLDVLDPGPEDSGLGLGGVGGFGMAPERLFSPVFRVGVDRTFGMDRYEWQTTVGAGVRVRVFPRAEEHVALTFSAFRVDLLGETGVPDSSDYGLAVFYSAAVFERR